MQAGHFLDFQQWPRRSLFEFFRHYELPFFGVCSEVNVTQTRRWCREHEQSFALASWFICQQVVNRVEEFRLRLRGERVWAHQRLSLAITVAQPDETFRFSYLPHGEAFASFAEQARAEMSRPASEEIGDSPENDAVIHGSTLPWRHFTSVTHPRRLGTDDSVPKIVFGRFTEREGELAMPISVEVHHALMDGRHVARFFEEMEREMARPEDVLA